MMKHVMVTGVLMATSMTVFAQTNDRPVWPQPEGFYDGQAEQNYRTIDPSVSRVAPSTMVQPLAVQPQQQNYVAPQPQFAYGQYPQQYGQYPQYQPNMGGYYPSQPMGYYPNQGYNNNGMPFNQMSSMMPPVPNSFSMPNPADTMNSFSFPGFPSFGNNSFNPFNFGR